MKDKANCLLHWLTDLKSGKAIEHQPKRNTFHSQWFLTQREKENNPVRD
jgi:hypothetical protein